ncbi:MAG: ABC transporter permease [Cyanobacteria bacterium]|nr:ABC transporter permease [Cyanobacteriota bacterium]
MFTLVCVLSLGIGMGALVALAIFGRVMIAPGAGINTDGLVEVLVLPEGPLRAKAGGWALEQWSYPDYRALREADTGMAVSGWVRESAEFGSRVAGETEMRRVDTLYVSANYFSTFGVTLAKGPGFDPAIDDAPTGEPRVVLGEAFWRLQMNSDSDVVGKSIMLDGVLHTVVGVAPEGFRGHFHRFTAPGSVVFVPLERHSRLKPSSNVRDDRSMDWIHIHARLNPGVDIKRADALVATIVSGLSKQYPSTNEFKAAAVQPYASLGAAQQRLIQHLFFEALLLAIVAAAISGFVLFGIPAPLRAGITARRCPMSSTSMR